MYFVFYLLQYLLQRGMCVCVCVKYVVNTYYMYCIVQYVVYICSFTDINYIYNTNM